MICLYLRRSFQRRFLRHFSLFWIMMCAFLLPLVVSTYRDSMEYGARLQLNSINKECAFHILEAAPEDLELFRNIDGLTEPFYEDGTIYLSYESEELWQKSTDLEMLNSMSDEEFNDYFAEDQRIKDALHSAIDKSSRNLEIVGYAYDMWSEAMDNPDMEGYLKKILYINIALLLFSGVVVYSAYENHIISFSHETADLRALGATKGQIAWLFLAEFGIIFPLSSLGAIGLSRSVMRYLYEHFLGNTADSATMWEVFYMNPRNTALEILFYFLVCLCVLTVSLMHKPGSRKDKQPRTQSTSLHALWIHRTKPPIVHCLLILVPLVTAFILLFNSYLDVRKQYDVEGLIVIQSGGSGFTQEELRIADELAGAGCVEKIREVSDKYLLVSSDGNSFMVNIQSFSDLAPHSPPLEGNEIAVDLPEEKTSLGIYHLEEIMHPEKQIEVTLTRIVELEDQDPWAVNVYISDELMQQLKAETPVNILYIHSNGERAKALENALREHMPSAYLVNNHQNRIDVNAKRQEGRLRLLSWIFCILMSVAMQIVWVRLAAYVQSCELMLKILFQMGGSRRQLFNLIPVWLGAVLAVILPYIIAIPWIKMQANQKFILSGPILCIYAVIAVFTFIVFLLPVKRSLHKILENAR